MLEFLDSNLCKIPELINIPSRVIYSKVSEKVDLEKAMSISSTLCIISYLLVSLSKNPIIGLIGCGLTGFSVGIMWPGTFSLAAKSLKGRGTAMLRLRMSSRTNASRIYFGIIWTEYTKWNTDSSNIPCNINCGN